MKTTIEIHDGLLLGAKLRAKKTGRTLRSIVEEGLREVLAKEPIKNTYKMPDMSVGDPNGENPLKKYTWPQLRAIMYGEEEYEEEPE